MQKTLIKCMFVLALIQASFFGMLNAYAGSTSLNGLSEEQADEKQDLEQMKQELSAIKSSINEGLQGLSKIDTNTLKDLQEFHLVCKTAMCEISPGKTIECYTYNGILPGPIIRVKEGQLVRLIIHNQLNTTTSLDLHGLILPASVDGLPSARSGLVDSGQTYAYQFIAKPAGTYWYHPQIMHCDQKVKGMYGAFIVEPSGPPVKSADQDLALVLSDIAVAKNEKADAPNASYIAGLPTGRPQQLVFYLVNGKTAPHIPALEVSPNSRVRLRVINSGQHAVPLHITGHKFEVVSLNGNVPTEQTTRDTLTLGVSDRADLEFNADNPGIWTLGSELIEQLSNNGSFPGGQVLLLKYTNK